MNTNIILSLVFMLAPKRFKRAALDWDAWQNFLVLRLESYLTGKQSMLSKPEFSSGFVFASCYRYLLSESHCTIVTSDVKESGVPLANPSIQPYWAIISRSSTAKQLREEGTRVRVCSHTRTHTDNWKAGDKIEEHNTEGSGAVNFYSWYRY